jgi:hypothetical protein
VPLKTASLASLKERFRELARAEPHLGIPHPDGRDEHLEQEPFLLINFPILLFHFGQKLVPI